MSKKPVNKQHDLRSPTLKRLAEDMRVSANAESELDPASLTLLRVLAGIFEKRSEAESKLR